MNEFAFIEDLNSKNTIILSSEKFSLVESTNNKANAKTSFASYSLNVNELQTQLFFIDTAEVDVIDKVKNEYSIYDNTVSATVTNDNVSSFASATVADKDFTPISNEGYAVLMAAYKNTNLIDSASSDLFYNSLLIESNSAMISNNVLVKIKVPLDEISTTVSQIRDQLILKPVSTLVSYGIPEGMNTKTSFNRVTINVESNLPISPGATAGKGDLKNLNIQMQIGSFYQMYLDFNGAGVKSISGLPIGLEFIKSEKCIKGSPKSAGKYPLKVIFENETFIPGLIEIPVLTREW